LKAICDPIVKKASDAGGSSDSNDDDDDSNHDDLWANQVFKINFNNL